MPLATRALVTEMEAKEARGADAAAPGLWNRWVLAVGAAGLAAGAALLGWNAAVELARVKDERDAEARGRKDAEEVRMGSGMQCERPSSREWRGTPPLEHHDVLASTFARSGWRP